MDIELLFERANIIRLTRAFFDGKNYLSLDTPSLSPSLIPETCLEVFKTDFLYGDKTKLEARKELYLVPSPEIWIKKIIAQKKINVYEICKCFRNSESLGTHHSPEFTMLEYYTMNFNYIDSIKLTEELFSFLLENKNLLRFQNEDEIEELKPPFLRLTMEEAFTRYAGFSLDKAGRDGTLLKEARHLGIEIDENTSAADLYNLIFIHCVEPSLPKHKPCVLLDYPAIVPVLAKSRGGAEGAFTKERWELYVRGIELANCYSEETDARNVKEYFENEGRLKTALAQVRHNIDADYWKIFLDFPECSGVALGLDRLIMCLLGRRTIDGVLPFQAFL